MIWTHHGGTHGSPVGPLLYTSLRANKDLGSRRAKPGSAHDTSHVQHPQPMKTVICLPTYNERENV